MDIRFVGCRTAPFETAPRSDPTGARRYEITYPILNDVGADDYIAPLTHELGHVFQLQQAGSIARLRESLSSRRIELGADYLTGVVLRQFVRGSSTSRFQHSLSLIGLYVEGEQDAHGAPEQRVGAFRSGFFVDFQGAGGTVEGAHAYFQDYLYANIEPNR